MRPRLFYCSLDLQNPFSPAPANHCTAAAPFRPDSHAPVQPSDCSHSNGDPQAPPHFCGYPFEYSINYIDSVVQNGLYSIVSIEQYFPSTPALAVSPRSSAGISVTRTTILRHIRLAPLKSVKIAPVKPLFSCRSALIQMSAYLIENKGLDCFFKSFFINHLRTLFHSSPGSPLFAICSPKHTGGIPLLPLKRLEYRVRSAATERTSSAMPRSILFPRRYRLRRPQIA